MQSVLIISDAVLNLYVWIVIVSAVMSWLVAFNVINTTNKFVNQVGYVLHRLTEPALRYIRAVVPQMGGVDLSPIALIFGIWFLRLLMREYLWPLTY